MFDFYTSSLSLNLNRQTTCEMFVFFENKQEFLWGITNVLDREVIAYHMFCIHLLPYIRFIHFCWFMYYRQPIYYKNILCEFKKNHHQFTSFKLTFVIASTGGWCGLFKDLISIQRTLIFLALLIFNYNTFF